MDGATEPVSRRNGIHLLRDAGPFQREGWILVSGFISPGERAVLGEIRAGRFGPHVRLLPYGIPARFDPSVELSREIAEEASVLLSPFPETVPWGKVTRANCVEMNRLGKLMSPA